MLRSALGAGWAQGLRRSSAMAAVRSSIGEELGAMREAGTFKTERVIQGRQETEVMVEGRSTPVLNLCANNYLGLSAHPAVVEGGRRALGSHGAGLSSVRFICGTQDIHRELERKLAAFHRQEDCILYAACFDANAGLFEVLLGPDDAVLSDALNHASIIDGIRLCKARRLPFAHMDMGDLEAKLKDASSARRRLIVSDGVFSMDGDVAPLKDICDLADAYDAMVFLDDCHATGFLGPSGRGTEEHTGVEGRVDVLNSTLGKALGGAMGGYTVGPAELVSLLRNRSRPYLFSNSLAPAVVGSAIAALDLITETPLAGSLRAKTELFRRRMREAGFTVAGDPLHPICPVMLGDARLGSAFADAMLEEGVFVVGFSFPVVPRDKARIRVQISAAHSEEQINRAVDAFVRVGKRLGAIS